MEVALIQVFLVNVPSKLKHEIPRHLYHSKANSNQNRKSHFSLVWVIDFSIISSCLGKFKVFSFFSFYLKKKTFCCSILLYSHALFAGELGHLDFSMVQKSLPRLARIKSRRFLFMWLENLTFLSSYLLPPHKKNLITRKITLTELIHNILRVYWRNTLA